MISKKYYFVKAQTLKKTTSLILKMKELENKTKNELLVAIFLLSSIIWLNVLNDSFITHTVGIAFIIATVYGVVCIMKNQKFLF